jgi:hypothetical protein
MNAEEDDVIVVGAGFSGLYAVHIRELGDRVLLETTQALRRLPDTCEDQGHGYGRNEYTGNLIRGTQNLGLRAPSLIGLFPWTMFSHASVRSTD